jgi:uncharacterized protein
LNDDDKVEPDAIETEAVAAAPANPGAMSVTTSRSDGVPDEESIRSFLTENPDFFARHPELTTELAIPHAMAGAASLLEYQAKLLQQKNRELQEQLQGLVTNARDNESVSARLHDLSVALLSQGSATDTFAEIYQALAENFRADCSAIWVFATPVNPEARGCGEFVGAEAAASGPMLACLRTKRPVCGALDDESAMMLFAELAPSLRSAALVPLDAERLRGVLAIGSFDSERFGLHVGTLFLEQLGRLVSHAVARHVR